MDISRLETKTGAEKGAILHLRHPALGYYLYTGDGCDADGQWDGTGKPTPITVEVRGMESKTVRDKLKKHQSDRVKQPNVNDEELGLDFVCSLVIAINGLTVNGKPMEQTTENKRAFFKQSDAIVEQVLDFAKDRANFFEKASSV